MKASPTRVLTAFLKTAKIQHPPRKLKLFVERIPVKLKSFFKTILDMIEEIQANDPDEDVTYLLKDIGYVRMSDLDYLKERIKEGWRPFQEELENMEHHVEVYLENNDTQIRKQILRLLSGALGDFQTFWGNQAQEFWETAEAIEEEWRDQIDDPKLTKRFTRLAKAIQGVSDLSQEVPAKLTEQLRLIAPRDTIEPERPASEDVEPLYHASIYARQLYRKGFDEKPRGTAGIGGSTEGISFTSDLYVAKEVMRSLKEAIMIAKGQVHWDEIMDWARREGIKHELDKYFRPDLRDPRFDKRDPRKVMDLYKAYLTFSESEGGRYNPLFFMENLDAFRRANSRNVGVVVADVDMTDPEIRYLAAMHEYRVPPRAVLEISKLIQ